MNNNKNTIKQGTAINHGALIYCAVLVLQLLTPSVLAEEGGQRSWYIGGGLGITELDPDTDNTGYTVTDEKDSGFKLFAGYDYSERLSVEAFYTDLGSAEIGGHVIKPDGEIDYSTLGASALWYVWRNKNATGDNLRKGLQAYVHGGLSFLDNSSSVDYSQDNSFQIQYGAGIEYGMKDGLALRAAVDLYDKDAGMVYIGILKRFGGKTTSEAVITQQPEPVVVDEVVQTQQVIIPAVAITYDMDSDGDGVVDKDDRCADSPDDIRVDEEGCSIISLQMAGVNFEPQSYELTEASKKILDEAVITINASPELQSIEVQAHTDSRGSEKYNLKLSENRAESVRSYLVSQGVAESRLVAKGYGETKPIADNDSEEGRAKNRRVELKVVDDKKPGVITVDGKE